MDRAVPAQSHHLRNAAGIVPIGLVAHRRQRNPHMPGFHNNDRNPGWLQFATRCPATTLRRPRGRGDPPSLKSAADRLWLRADLGLANRDALAVDDAKTGFFQADVQSNVKFYPSSPLCQRPPKSLHQALDSTTVRLSPCTAFSEPDLKSRLVRAKQSRAR